jgi:hypothetical protein
VGGLRRKLERQKAKAEDTLVYKKVAARKLGISVSEYNRRMKRREKNLKEITGGNENGKG